MKKLVVLLVEDSELDAELAAASLADAQLDCDLHRVETRETLVRALNEREWDLVLCDYRLPTFDGMTALGVVQRLKPEVPFIFLSGALGEELAIEALKSGATDYVLKDRRERLVPVVRRALQESAERRARRHAENALRESLKNLEYQNQVVRAITDSASACFFMMDREGRTTFINPAAAQVTGFELEELKGRVLHEVIHPHGEPGSATCAECAMQRILRSHKPETGMRDTFRRKDGTMFPAVCNIVPVIEDGEMTGIVLELRDTTEETRAADELLKAKEAAEAANRAKDQFLAVLSHELRTPLTPVLMTAAALAQDPDLPADLREDLQMMQRNIELEARLIDDLLDLTRIARGKLELRFEAVDVHAIVDHALGTCCENDVRKKRLSITCEKQAICRYVWADAARLEQVVWNLLKNAVKFTPAGGHITIRVYNGEDNRVLIEVRDSGIGIGPEVMPRIFNAFDQGLPSITKHFGGLGLGLAIARALVQSHGGRIAVASDGKDLGATFTVSLPTIDMPAGLMNDPTSVDGAADAALRILLVEDHENTRRVVAKLLRRANHSVSVAPDVASAKQIAENEAFDLVISDLGLPDGSGFELMQYLRDKYGLKGIAISGYGTEDDQYRSRKAGFLHHLVKPIDFRLLTIIIRQAVATT